MEKIDKKSGQALLEYILLISILVSVFTLVMRQISDSDLLVKLKKPLEKDFKFTYQYGHPEARGQNDGGPKNIPQHHERSQNFRIFINPPIIY